MPNIYIIAGCNGSGKTTAAFTVLPEIFDCKEFVNADEIARGLSPFQPETVSFQAGRIMLSRIKELIAEKKDFAFETTLATKSYAPLLKKAIENGYQTWLVLLWLSDVNIAYERVQERVERGGHNIPTEVIFRRRERGLKNFFSLYQSLSTNWIFYNNSNDLPVPIAKGTDHWQMRFIMLKFGSQLKVMTESDKVFDKITAGMRLAVKRLIEKRQQENGNLIISRNGKVVKIKAREIKIDKD